MKFPQIILFFFVTQWAVNDRLLNLCYYHPENKNDNQTLFLIVKR